MIIDGRQLASQILAGLKKRPRPMKKLVAVLVGEDPASLSFLKQKEKAGHELGIDFELRRFTEDINQAELIKNIMLISAEPGVGGVIVQLPLPLGLDRDQVLSAIAPDKDVDGLIGNALPPAVLVVEDVLNYANFDLNGRSVGVVGKGFLVGDPIAKWLRGKCGRVVIFDSKSDLAGLKNVDLVISGTGKAGLITDDMLKPSAGVIDFGYGKKDGKLMGDYGGTGATFYTPTPGGTGPILVAELFKNFYTLNS